MLLSPFLISVTELMPRFAQITWPGCPTGEEKTFELKPRLLWSEVFERWAASVGLPPGSASDWSFFEGVDPNRMDHSYIINSSEESASSYSKADYTKKIRASYTGVYSFKSSTPGLFSIAGPPTKKKCVESKSDEVLSIPEYQSLVASFAAACPLDLLRLFLCSKSWKPTHVASDKIVLSLMGLGELVNKETPEALQVARAFVIRPRARPQQWKPKIVGHEYFEHSSEDRCHTTSLVFSAPLTLVYCRFLQSFEGCYMAQDNIYFKTSPTFCPGASTEGSFAELFSLGDGEDLGRSSVNLSALKALRTALPDLAPLSDAAFCELCIFVCKGNPLNVPPGKDGHCRLYSEFGDIAGSTANYGESV